MKREEVKQTGTQSRMVQRREKELRGRGRRREGDPPRHPNTAKLCSYLLANASRALDRTNA